MPLAETLWPEEANALTGIGMTSILLLAVLPHDEEETKQLAQMNPSTAASQNRRVRRLLDHGYWVVGGLNNTRVQAPTHKVLTFGHAATDSDPPKNSGRAMRR